MDSFSTYLYQSGISIAVFYLFYWALLRKETWFSLNRILLGLSLLMALLIPFVRITLRANPEPGTVYYVLDRYLMDGVIVHPGSLAKSTGIYITGGKALLSVYLLGLLFFTVKFLVQIVQIFHLIKKHGITESEGYRIVPITEDLSPFSFFTLIFINTEKLEKQELKSILLHEWEHVHRLHTLDILLLEIICIIQWFNPFVWLYKYSLHELHEYEADQAVISQGENRLNYQKLILNQAFGHQFFQVSHNLINRSFIKKRIIMITKRKSGDIALLKFFLLLPVAAMLVISFSFTREPENMQQVKKILQSNTAEIIPLKKSPEVKNPGENLSAPKTTTQKKTGQDTTVFFYVVEDMPKFQSGDINTFRKWVAEHVQYPEEAAAKGISGKLYVQFVVERDGSVDRVKVVRGADSLLNREAVRVIKSSPKWEPGKQRGKKVAVAYTVPIVFVMDETKEPALQVSDSSEVFFIVEDMPKFKGGDIKNFRKWVAENIKYPDKALKEGISGRVYIQFIVEPDGHVDHVKVIRGIYPSLDAEALRVVKSSPRWEPGKQRGKNVAVAFTFPITFVTDHEVPARDSLKNAKGEKIIYVIDGKKASEEELKKIGPDRIARVQASKDKKDIEKYGSGDEDGVIFINTYQKKVKGPVPEKPGPPVKK